MSIESRNSLEGWWNRLVESVKATATSAEFKQFPELAERVGREAERFAGLPVPETDKQWYDRRQAALETRKGWSRRLSELRTGRAMPNAPDGQVQSDSDRDPSRGTHEARTAHRSAPDDHAERRHA
jgi:hypothetical protein